MVSVLFYDKFGSMAVQTAAV